MRRLLVGMVCVLVLCGMELVLIRGRDVRAYSDVQNVREETLMA